MTLGFDADWLNFDASAATPRDVSPLALWNVFLVPT
jgi:hypothetical protein